MLHYVQVHLNEQYQHQSFSFMQLLNAVGALTAINLINVSLVRQCINVNKVKSIDLVVYVIALSFNLP